MESFVENVDRQKVCSIGVDKIERMLYYANKNKCSLEQANEKMKREMKNPFFGTCTPVESTQI